ncbi:MAG TPA: NAD(P)/FAD-dependent oxidoreductase [Bacteroidales bacterium]|jgi:L-2-hydroxyglutarate oxidase LhgO|nr:NAD(P)/FAD-dependent oxidoreductase [Bacteroidales bacterium]
MDAEITIIGAGVVGLAIAERISQASDNVFVLEKHLSFGQETSSRNSEVIHAGIYYPRNSLKSRLCVEGKRLLYDYCRKHDIPFNNCGKLIVAASDDEIKIIDGIRNTAFNNGVTDLLTLDQAGIAKLEPDIFALKALYSPSTGIVDSHSLMKSYESGAINNGAQVVYGSEVTGIRKISNGYEITTTGKDGNVFSFTSRLVINSAGLTSDKISEMAGMKDDNLKIHFCKGEYFRLNPPKNRLIRRLVYPVPVHNLEGIGIHVTIDMAGGVKLGPDVTYLDTNTFDYTVSPEKQEAFYNSAKKFLPFLEFGDISPEMAGIRPKIQKKGEPVRDFYIREESDRGNPGFINLIGIESPGLTSSLAIANYVHGLIIKRF